MQALGYSVFLVRDGCHGAVFLLRGSELLGIARCWADVGRNERAVEGENVEERPVGADAMSQFQSGRAFHVSFTPRFDRLYG